MSDDFEKQISKLAKSVAQKAEEAELPEATEALKVLTQLYALKLKHRPDDPDDDETFGGITDRLNKLQEAEDGAANGTTRVRSRPRRADS